MHRRDFLHTAAAAGLASSLPASSWAGLAGANESLRIGVIGCGLRGLQLARALRIRGAERGVVVAKVCDVFRPRLEEAREHLGIPETGATMDHHEVLGDDSLDAVLIATPDHWHARLAIEALGAGKHVLLETPLSHTIEQALEVRDAALASDRVFAVAAQHCGRDAYWKLRDAIRFDRLGPISWSQGGFGVNGRIPMFGQFGTAGVSADPRNNRYLWWDRWQGVEHGLAEEAPIDADRFFRYQKYYEYSNGMAGEVLFGQLAPLLLTLAGPKGEPPRRVVSGGGNYTHFDGRATPDQIFGVLDFASEHTIVMAGSSANDVTLDVTVRGRRGTATFTPEGVHVAEQAGFYPEFRGGNKDMVDAGMSRDARGRWIPDPPAGEVGFTIPTEARPDVLDNFVASVRGEATPYCGADLAFCAMVGARMISEAQRTDKVLLWDRESQRLSAV